MNFDWTQFNSAFLMNIIKDSDMTDIDKKMCTKNADDKEYLVSRVNFLYSKPNKNFIKKYREIIERDILKKNRTEVENICIALNIHGKTHNEQYIKLTEKTTSASLIDAYIRALYDISGINTGLNELSKFRYEIEIDMTETVTEDISLYDYQKDVVSKLINHYITEDKNSGIMVMPTGSGKTRTSTYFLIKEMISRGYQILWIVHRHILIDQAADSFYKFAGLAKIIKPDMKLYRISCISGKHMNIRQVGKSDVIVASISSIWRNKDHLKRILGKKVMIVVDEAHHTHAPTYQDVIRFVRKCKKGTKLLGLTATPVRSVEKESIKLMDLFDNNIICNISMSDLIVKGILSDPVFEHVSTGENFEPEITVDEERLIRKYGELPASVINKIAESRSRNNVILDQYLKNREKYGKTLIFALNIIHCRFLYKELIDRGINAGIVYSGKEDNSTVINEFRNNKLEVLVNVNIMTEGTDVPDIQTVFLTRPTSSEGLLMQMIGRGMRGTKAQGTEKVNIVDFNDQWSVFNRWLNSEWLILEEMGKDDEISEREKRKVYTIEYEWSLLADVYNSVKYAYHGSEVKVSMPVGWYTLVDKDGELHRMLVFENQIEAFKQITKDRKIWKNDLTVTAGYILQKYFGGFGFMPSEREMELYMDNVRNMELPPSIHVLENRKSIDPYYVAIQFENDKGKVFEMGPKIYAENPIISDLYKDANEYIMEICHAMIFKDSQTYIGMGVKELPDEVIPFDLTPYYNLDGLVQEVTDEMFGGEFDGIKKFLWTDKVYNTYFGLHQIDLELNHIIKINKVLNSKDVPREVVKYVIYHEMLHRDNMSHDKNFKLMEHEYPNYAECEYFLHGYMQKFDIKEW